jgi:transketolase
VIGIEQNTGALGHGLSISVGLALAAKLDNRDYRVYTLLGDGELAEGSSWEASMTAAHYQLDNLVVIVDRNTLQITGPTEEVNGLEPLVEKFKAFGYAVYQCNGNDVNDLLNIFNRVLFETGKPSLILANTVKGKGVSFMEHTVKWHHRVPSDSEYDLAMAELESASAALLGVKS